MEYLRRSASAKIIAAKYLLCTNCKFSLFSNVLFLLSFCSTFVLFLNESLNFCGENFCGDHFWWELFFLRTVKKTPQKSQKLEPAKISHGTAYTVACHEIACLPNRRLLAVYCRIIKGSSSLSYARNKLNMTYKLI